MTRSDRYLFEVPGHSHRYHLSPLLPYYGTAFCDRFATAWTRAVMFENWQTSHTYFKAVRKLFEWVAMHGLMHPGSAEEVSLLCFRDSKAGVPPEKEWRQVVSNASGAILEPGNKTFIDTERPASRNKKVEALRSGLERLTNEGLVPFALPEGRLEERGSVVPKCLATLSFEAGRLDVSGLNPKEAYEAFITRNREMLDELRRLLWDELKQNLDLFEKGRRLLHDCPVQDLRQLEDVLNATTLDDIRSGAVSRKLMLNKEQEFAAALLLRRHAVRGGRIAVGYEKTRAFLEPIVSNSEAQPYFEATTVALNAAYHIVMLDTGANSQPIDDLPLDLYKGSAKRGRRLIRSLRMVKNRAGGKAVPAALGGDALYLSSKSSPTRVAGTDVVEVWKTLTEPMRSASGPTAERLWVWRKPWETKVRTSLTSMGAERWSAFLRRISSNPLVGGLPITRPIIRKAVANAKGEGGDLAFAIQKALLGHSNAGTTFQYLSEGAVRAYLNSQIRDFLNALEGVAAIGIEGAAKQLGVPERDLFRRAQLGLENGLDFAAVKSTACEAAHHERRGSALLDAAKSFSASVPNMVSLELARRALRNQFDAMVNLNPLRFMRVWVPWMAIVEGYCDQLEKSRFRLRFKRCCEDVERQLEAGELRVPVLW